jgi:VWFA-related protein
MTRRTKTAWIARAALSILAVTLVSAQQQGQPGQQKPPVFRTNTDYITTDVIARDRQQRFIPGLTIKDFEVYEDGVKQEVSNFTAVVGGRVLTETAPVVAVRREGLILPPTKPSTDMSGRVFIIFIDDMHLQALDSIKARQVLKDIRDNLLHEGDLIAIVSTGYSSIQVDLTYDVKKKRFTEAIEKVLGSGMTPREIIDAAQTREGPAGLRHNAFVAFSTAYDMLEQVQRIPNRRKAFIYVSSGYDFNPFTNARFKAIQDAYGTPLRDETGSNNSGDLSREDVNRHRNPFELNGQQFAESDLISALAELTRTARRSNVTFYTLDPRGLIAGSDISVQLSIEEWSRFVDTSVSSLRVLADETGGFCACQTNNFKGAIQRIDNEMSDYYMLGYTSTNPDPLKVYRRIEIKLKDKPDATLIYKEGYRIKR